jgi:hypothetical protein
MPDGTSRLSHRGRPLRHYMGTSTFAECTVLPEIALAKIRKDAPLETVCLFGCAVTTGIGAVLNTAKVEPGSTVAVWGLGGVGLSVIQGAVMAGAERIIAIDTNPKKFELARQFGATETLSPAADTLRARSGLICVSGLAATMKMYQRVASRATSLAARNWLVLLSFFAYAAILFLARAVLGALAPFGMGVMWLGGLAMSLVFTACAASFLYLVEMIVRTNRVTLADFQRSFGVYLWDVMGVAFVLWIVFRLLTPALMTLPQGAMLLFALNVLILVFGNAVPELIYLGHHSTLALLSESYRFVGENWLEWFPPNLLLIGILAMLNARSWARVIASSPSPRCSLLRHGRARTVSWSSAPAAADDVPLPHGAIAGAQSSGSLGAALASMRCAGVVARQWFCAGRRAAPSSLPATRRRARSSVEALRVHQPRRARAGRARRGQPRDRCNRAVAQPQGRRIWSRLRRACFEFRPLGGRASPLRALPAPRRPRLRRPPRLRRRRRPLPPCAVGSPEVWCGEPLSGNDPCVSDVPCAPPASITGDAAAGRLSLASDIALSAGTRALPGSFADGAALRPTRCPNAANASPTATAARRVLPRRPPRRRRRLEPSADAAFAVSAAAGPWEAARSVACGAAASATAPGARRSGCTSACWRTRASSSIGAASASRSGT